MSLVSLVAILIVVGVGFWLVGARARALAAAYRRSAPSDVSR